MGINDTEGYDAESKYLEAALTNDVMLKDPAVKNFIYRKLKKAIDEAKVGKIYCSGFYHTGVGDMIGYLQYAAGEEPVGCLNAHELYSENFDCGDIISFRSPLVDPSEVNKIKIVRNEIINRWFGYFKDQDIVMFNMYDISAPQQGGADFDGDLFYLCDDPIVINSKIDKNIIIDIEDKATAKSLPYTKENIIEYEVMTRDNRIGEITNCSTNIENRYTTNEGVKKVYSDYSSLLRIFQGKEIDFLKTGVRWQLSGSLRKQLKQLPYFLLYNYPDKMKTYNKIREKNKQIENTKDKIKLNAYHSPSPMNELCEYICEWEKKHILWDNDSQNLIDSKCLIINNRLDLSNKKYLKLARRRINEYADELKKHFNMKENDSNNYISEEIVKKYKTILSEEIAENEETVANYVIKASYGSLSASKSLAWSGYGDYIIKNLKENSNHKRNISIKETPYITNDSYEYLGKYFEFTEGGM